MISDIRSNKWMATGKYVLMIAFILGLTHVAFGQGAASTIVGAVKDATGAAVPAVTITITNTARGISRQVSTDGTGDFSAPDLDAGQYTITAVKNGYKTEQQTQIQVNYQRTRRVDFVLAVGHVVQTVVVTATGSGVQTDDATTDTTLEKHQVVDLPLNGRNFIQLAQLVPGTTPGSPGSGNTGFTGQGFALSAYGQRDYNNQYTLDGVDMTEARNPSPEFLPSVDAIREFDVKSGLYSAEYGWKAGAHIAIALQGGTNKLHGSAYDFLRNNEFNARNYFNTRVDSLHRNQFGGTLGGPLKRNRIFFFLAYDGTRQTDGVTTTGVVPTPQELAGTFSSPIIDPKTNAPFPNNQIQGPEIDKNATLLASFYPAPNTTGVSNFTRSGPSFDNDNEGFARVDYSINDKDHLFGHYVQSYRIFGDPPLIANFTTNNPIWATNIALQETHIFTPRAVNSLTLGYSYYKREIADATIYASVAGQLTIPDVASNPLTIGIPVINILGYAGLGQGSFSPLIFVNKNFQLSDNFQFQKGRHFINAGFQAAKFQFRQTFIVYPRGSFSFTGYATGNPIADFLLGLPLQTAVANKLTPGDIRNTPNSYYIQDNWQVSPNLTVNLGFRYEFWPPVHDVNGFARNLDLQTGNLFPATNIPVPLWNLDKSDAAPRFGFAYRPFSNDQTVLRGGTGIYYSTPELNLVTDGNLNPPFGVTNSFETTAGLPPLTFENPYPTTTELPQGAPTIYAMASNFQSARTLLWNLDVQHSIKNYLLDIGYTGSSSTRIARNLAPNQPVPGPGNPQLRRTFPQYGSVLFFESNESSNYEALLIKAEKRLSSGLFFLGAYTFSKALDYGGSPIFGDGTEGGFQNAKDLAAEYGLASFNLKHRLSFSVGYELPFGHGMSFASHLHPLGERIIGGWQINGILTAQSGSPFSLFVGGDPAGINGDGTLRPDRLANGNLPSSKRTVSRWFDTSAFVAPPPYKFGNSGRDILIGPGKFDMDLSLFKNVNLNRLNLQLRAEVFNSTNHANFGIPGQTLGTPTYGSITTAGDPRILQLAAKIIF